jgi:hypothetical protein
VNVVRGALLVVILFNLALLAAAAPLRSILLRYDIARKQQELSRLSLESRSLFHSVALARRPDRVAARAAQFGIDLHLIDADGIISKAGLSPARTRPAANAPRR